MTHLHFPWRPCAAAAALACAGAAFAQSQQAPAAPVTAGTPATAAAAAAVPASGQAWQTCAALTDNNARLACFDTWARNQTPPAAAAAQSTPTVDAKAPEAPAQPAKVAGAENGCYDRHYSALSRFWELEQGTDCGTFNLRGYRPIIASVVASNGVNTQPTSPAPGHTAATAQPFRDQETRIQLSARVKLMKDIFLRDEKELSDSLWVGFTQQSYWQFFNRSLSRPFRTTDYEPELVYVRPTRIEIGDMKLRFATLGITHQSNGQALPLSRSWNRIYLGAGAEWGDSFNLTGRIWTRIHESHDDDNPDIMGYVGRAELSGTWRPNPANTWVATWRTPLRANGNGSVRLEYFRAIGKGARQGNLNDLRLYAQVFHGYGDSLVDYNRRRTVLGIGLALVDW
jgi:phospholipase A1